MIIKGIKNTDNSVSKLVNDLNYLCKYRDIGIEFSSFNESSDTIVCQGKQLKTLKTAWTYGFDNLVYKVFYHYHYTSKLEVNKTYAPNILILGIPIKNRLDGYVKSQAKKIIREPLINLMMSEYKFAYDKFLCNRGIDLNRENFDREYKDFSKNSILINHIMEKYIKVSSDEADRFFRAMKILYLHPHNTIFYSIQDDRDYWEKYENDLINLLLKTDYTFSFKVARKEFEVDNFIPYFAIDTNKNKAYCNGFIRGVPIEDFIDELYEKKLSRGENSLYSLSRVANKSSYTIRTVTGKYFTLGSREK